MDVRKVCILHLGRARVEVEKCCFGLQKNLPVKKDAFKRLTYMVETGVETRYGVMSICEVGSDESKFKL